MTFTLDALEEYLTSCGVDFWEIDELSNRPNVVIFHFYGVKWYSFFKKRKIRAINRSINRYVERNKPATVLCIFSLHKEKKSA